MCKLRIFALTAAILMIPGFVQAQSAIPDDTVPLPGEKYFKPVPIQEVYKTGAPVKMPDESELRTVEEDSPPPDESSPASTPEAGAGWRVREGEDLRQVLVRWSEVAGVEVIWDCGDDFPVLVASEAGGSYTQAVGALLDQYEGQKIRPIAQLHVDPQTHERVLVVTSVNGG